MQISNSQIHIFFTEQTKTGGYMFSQKQREEKVFKRQKILKHNYWMKKKEFCFELSMRRYASTTDVLSENVVAVVKWCITGELDQLEANANVAAWEDESGSLDGRLSYCNTWRVRTLIPWLFGNWKDGCSCGCRSLRSICHLRLRQPTCVRRETVSKWQSIFWKTRRGTMAFPKKWSCCFMQFLSNGLFRQLFDGKCLWLIKKVNFCRILIGRYQECWFCFTSKTWSASHDWTYYLQYQTFCFRMSFRLSSRETGECWNSTVKSWTDHQKIKWEIQDKTFNLQNKMLLLVETYKHWRVVSSNRMQRCKFSKTAVEWKTLCGRCGWRNEFWRFR